MEGIFQAGESSHAASLRRRIRSEDSWIDISSQPSSSSLSSAADEVITSGLRVENVPLVRRRRQLRNHAPSGLQVAQSSPNTDGTSSQEEYEESESESDRVMTSSNEGLPIIHTPIFNLPDASPALQSTASDDDDDDHRTAVNYPTRNEQCFTPQPNAFSHPPSTRMRQGSVPTPGSYFPAQRHHNRPPLAAHHSLPNPTDPRRGHYPQNILSPSYNAAAQHEEALRTSLSTLLSCAAAARGLSKPEAKGATTSNTLQPRSTNRIDPMSFRLIPESALPTTTRQSPPTLDEPTFKPTIRRGSTSTATTTSEQLSRSGEIATKRKTIPAGSGRSASRERRSVKKARRTLTSEDLFITPTLLTWLISAGVVVALSALSFRAGYSMGKEAGRMESGGVVFAADEQVGNCAREAGRQTLGLRRSLARSAVQV